MVLRGIRIAEAGVRFPIGPLDSSFVAHCVRYEFLARGKPLKLACPELVEGWQATKYPLCITFSKVMLEYCIIVIDKSIYY